MKVYDIASPTFAIASLAGFVNLAFGLVLRSTEWMAYSGGIFVAIILFYGMSTRCLSDS